MSGFGRTLLSRILSALFLVGATFLVTLQPRWLLIGLFGIGAAVVWWFVSELISVVFERTCSSR